MDVFGTGHIACFAWLFMHIDLLLLHNFKKSVQDPSTRSGLVALKPEKIVRRGRH